MGNITDTQNHLDDGFWTALDALLSSSELVIEYPANSAHPRYPSFIHPVDYGYLRGTTSSDGVELDVWHGSAANGQLVAIVCTVDLVKRDSEIKLLVGCSDTEVEAILQTHNNSEFQKGILIRRPQD